MAAPGSDAFSRESVHAPNVADRVLAVLRDMFDANPIHGQWANIGWRHPAVRMVCQDLHGPLKLPTLTDGDVGKRTKPTTGDRDPELTEVCAWLADIIGETTARIARWLNTNEHGEPADAAHDNTHDGYTVYQRTYRRGERAIHAGQRRLRERGVLPWAAFSGNVPADWWTTPEFAAARDRWVQLAIESPSIEPNSTRVLRQREELARRRASGPMRE